MASTEPSDQRERRERDRERTKSPSTNGGGGGGPSTRQSSRNIRVLHLPLKPLHSKLNFLALFLLPFVVANPLDE